MAQQKKITTTELIQAICQMQNTIDELYDLANKLNTENKELKDKIAKMEVEYNNN